MSFRLELVAIKRRKSKLSEVEDQLSIDANTDGAGSNLDVVGRGARRG